MLQTVFTLGGFTPNLSLLSKYIEVANRFRLNTSHISHKNLKSYLSELAKFYKKINVEIPLIIDL